MTIVSQNRLINYIRRNPGLTTTQLAYLLRPEGRTRYTAGAFNSRLLKLTKQGKVIRVRGNSAVSDTFCYRGRMNQILIKDEEEFLDWLKRLEDKEDHVNITFHPAEYPVTVVWYCYWEENRRHNDWTYVYTPRPEEPPTSDELEAYRQQQAYQWDYSEKQH